MAARAKVVRADRSEPGWTRRRTGHGFAYLDQDGSPLPDDETRRLAELAVPPAWEDVWFAPNPRSHILATGIDAAGRRQYIYHPDWIASQDRTKHERVLDLAAALPSARGRVTRDLHAAPGSMARALAVAVRLVDATYVRVGDDRHTATTGHRGLTTLLCRHVDVRGDEVTLDFRGKSAQQWHVSTRDHDLAVAVRSLRKGRSDRARFLAHHEQRAWTALHARDVNAYVREITGTTCTTKDFRTLHGSVVAAQELARAGWSPVQAERDRAVREAIVRTAERLGNTPAVARASYVDPIVLTLFHDGTVIDLRRDGVAAYLSLVRESS